MTTYHAPINDIVAALDEAGLDEILDDASSGLDRDLVVGMLEEFGRLAAEVIAPTNPIGDQNPPTLGDGGVTTHPALAAAYRQYVEGGWLSVTFDPDYGGGGFPHLVGVALQEILTSANMAMSVCPLLSHGAIELLTHHGTPEQQERYLRPLIAGTWTGTMNLTEPDAGSDLGAVRTRAVLQDDGSYRVFGQKIFISYGDHDWTDNIIHMVLARTPDAPTGTAGVSCFIVPKVLVADDGSLGDRNDVVCLSLEHKLGIHASPTCVMSFGDDGGAVGYLVGEENEGMGYMFTMMNSARLGVGVGGVSIAERAYQQAVEYATSRFQGRAIDAAPGERSAIVEHPDVARMLQTMKTSIDAMRGLVYRAATALDRAGEERPDRGAWADRAALLTPVAKAWCSDLGVELTSLAIQIHGGVGYAEETGVAQHWRDARIAPIYEGTNGIQAIDLVTRKVVRDNGAALQALMTDIEDTIAALNEGGEAQSVVARQVGVAVDAVRRCSEWLCAQDNPNDVLAGATPFAAMVGALVGADVHANVILATRSSESEVAAVDAATFYGNHMLAPAVALQSAVTQGARHTSP